MIIHNGFCNLNLILNLDHVIILFINLYCMIANDRNKNLLLTGALIHEVFTAVGWIMYKIFICLKVHYCNNAWTNGWYFVYTWQYLAHKLPFCMVLNSIKMYDFISTLTNLLLLHFCLQHCHISLVTRVVLTFVYT